MYDKNSSYIILTFTVNKMGSHWVLLYCTSKNVLQWPEDDCLWSKYVNIMWPDCIYYITVLIYCCVLMVYNTLYRIVIKSDYIKISIQSSQVPDLQWILKWELRLWYMLAGWDYHTHQTLNSDLQIHTFLDEVPLIKSGDLEIQYLST